MKSTRLIFFFPLFFAVMFVGNCRAQQTVDDIVKKNSKDILATRSPLRKGIDINSRLYVRILDGFLLQDEHIFLPVNSVKKLADSASLEKLGLENFNKPYLILNTAIDDVRRYIFIKAKIGTLYGGVNLPVILNEQLITFEKYKLLKALDTNTIESVKYVKELPKNSKINIRPLPFGVIYVYLKK